MWWLADDRLQELLESLEDYPRRAHLPEWDKTSPQVEHPRFRLELQFPLSYLSPIDNALELLSDDATTTEGRNLQEIFLAEGIEEPLP